jgi:hypothetical protein
MLQSLEIVFVDLIRNKITPTTWMDLSLLFKIRTGQTGGQLLRKIFMDEICTVSLRD